ncbi:MAG TPA: hypothetical protein VKR52_13475 [Terracidiphilus sp.]|nr:hypothetical protein [Terracidiphilus sp.]
MARKIRKISLNEAFDALRAHGFDVAPYAGLSGGMLVSKHGVATVLAPGPDKFTPVRLAVEPGVLVRDEIARVVDRGYQKFIKTSQYELPASAAQLHAIHQFTEEVKEWAGGESLYNESLGTTSDVYLYDRLKGREPEPKQRPVRPWELTEGH